MSRMLVIFVCVMLLLCPSLAGCESVSYDLLPDGVLRVHFMDVGQADCTFIETADGHAVMIDTAYEQKADEICEYVSGLGYSHIDTLVLTHFHDDHAGGAEKILDTFSVGMVYMTDVDESDGECERIRALAEERGAIVRAARMRVQFSFGETCFRFLLPSRETHENINDRCAVLRLEYKSRSFLFMGDCGYEAERELLNCFPDISADVVKAGHHGGDDASGEELVAALGTGYVVYSCGEGNNYGHPSPRTTDRWERAGARSFRTDVDSTVVFCTDGEGMLCAGAQDRLYWKENTECLPYSPPTREKYVFCEYVLNTYYHYIHKHWCPYVENTDAEYLERTNEDTKRLISEGYVLCKYCFNTSED